MSESDVVLVERDGPVTVVTINRPDKRNAVNNATAEALVDAFRAFDADDTQSVAVITGAGGTFCAGADLAAIASGERAARYEHLGGDVDEGPMGPTRLDLSKPVIAAVEGYAVAGGLEIALWCDLRVAASSATFGVFCRRFGVPLIDGGTVRLPRLVGAGRAMDLILTGRAVPADEALAMGLANRVVDDGQALAAAVELAHEIAQFPQGCMRRDREAARSQWGFSEHDALLAEFRGSIDIVRREGQAGAASFVAGTGRGGQFPGQG